MRESIVRSYEELPLFLSAQNVADVLGVSISSAYELMHEDGFPSLRIGNRLVIPKDHIPSVDGVNEENSAVVAHIFSKIPAIAAAEGLVNGYRVVSNCGPDAGQTVNHLHFHILGGKQLTLEMA